MEKMSDRLKRARIKKYRTAKEFAEKNDIYPATYYHHEKGRNEFDPETAERYAKALGVTAGWLLTGENIPELIESNNGVELVPIVGEVEAGVYKNNIELEEAQWDYVTLPTDSRYPGHPRKCMRVCGPSMNMEFPEGSLVVCINMIALDEPPVNGVVYVVRRTLAGGDVEATLKELRIEPDGTMYLWPRSTDPRHQAPILFDGDEEGDEISLTAKVIGSYIIR